MPSACMCDPKWVTPDQVHAALAEPVELHRYDWRCSVCGAQVYDKDGGVETHRRFHRALAALADQVNGP